MRESDVEAAIQKAKIGMPTVRLIKKSAGVISWKKLRGVEPSEDDGAWFWGTQGEEARGDARLRRDMWRTGRGRSTQGAPSSGGRG